MIFEYSELVLCTIHNSADLNYNSFMRLQHFYDPSQYLCFCEQFYSTRNL
jgi:hypothetical protein